MVESLANGKLSEKRAQLLNEVNGDDVARAKLLDVEGTVIEFYRFRNEEDRKLNTDRLFKHGFDGFFEVGHVTVFHIGREEDSRRIREHIK